MFKLDIVNKDGSRVLLNTNMVRVEKTAVHYYSSEAKASKFFEFESIQSAYLDGEQIY